MRIRTIKPEFWKSEDTAVLSWEERLLFIGLWSYVDDNGVGRDNERLISAELFPLDEDPRETVARVSRGLARLSERDLITRYTVSGKNFLFVTGWNHQKIDKPAKPRYPKPSDFENGCATGDFKLREDDSRECRESVAKSPEKPVPVPGTRYQVPGSREQVPGTPSSSASGRGASDPDSFDRFWKTYPRKKGKDDARKAWKTATKTTDPDVIITALTQQLPAMQMQQRTDGDFRPYPATWLRQGRWQDEIETPTQPIDSRLIPNDHWNSGGVVFND